LSTDRAGKFPQGADPKCKAIFVENLANPGGVVVDIEKVAAIAHEAGVPLIVDNTLATLTCVGRSNGAPT